MGTVTHFFAKSEHVEVCSAVNSQLLRTCQSRAQVSCFEDQPATSAEPHRCQPFEESSSPGEASSAAGRPGFLISFVKILSISQTCLKFLTYLLKHFPLSQILKLFVIFRILLLQFIVNCSISFPHHPLPAQEACPPSLPFCQFLYLLFLAVLWEGTKKLFIASRNDQI